MPENNRTRVEPPRSPHSLARLPVWASQTARTSPWDVPLFSTSQFPEFSSSPSSTHKQSPCHPCAGGSGRRRRLSSFRVETHRSQVHDRQRVQTGEYEEKTGRIERFGEGRGKQTRWIGGNRSSIASHSSITRKEDEACSWLRRCVSFFYFIS